MPILTTAWRSIHPRGRGRWPVAVLWLQRHLGFAWMDPEEPIRLYPDHEGCGWWVQQGGPEDGIERWYDRCRFFQWWLPVSEVPEAVQAVLPPLREEQPLRRGRKWVGKFRAW